MTLLLPIAVGAFIYYDHYMDLWQIRLFWTQKKFTIEGFKTPSPDIFISFLK